MIIVIIVIFLDDYKALNVKIPLDLNILDLSVQFTQYGLEQSGLPHNLQWELAITTDVMLWSSFRFNTIQYKHNIVWLFSRLCFLLLVSSWGKKGDGRGWLYDVI